MFIITMLYSFARPATVANMADTILTAGESVTGMVVWHFAPVHAVNTWLRTLNLFRILREPDGAELVQAEEHTQQLLSL